MSSPLIFLYLKCVVLILMETYLYNFVSCSRSGVSIHRYYNCEAKERLWIGYIIL